MISGRPGACSRQSLAENEPLAGTVSGARGYLLLEHGGPWAAKAFDGLALPDVDGESTELANWLVRASKAAGVTPLLVRRHGTRPGLPPRPFLGVVALDAHGGRGAHTHLDDVHALRRWDVGTLLDGVANGDLPTGWEPMTTQYLVCTHGRRDVCCAELGRPLAAVLEGLASQQLWECSHLGGHRLAANVLTLPGGHVYGRLDPDDALDLVAAHADGRVLVKHLRGRGGLTPAVQAAEIALRRAAGVDAADGVRLEKTHTEGDRTSSGWRVGDATWRVVVQIEQDAGRARSASCGAEPTPPPPAFTIVEVTDVEAAGRGAAGWDEAHGAATGVDQPNDVVVELVQSLTPGTALDLACGTGRHAMWLAGRGWDVTAVDFSAAGLERARTEATRRLVSVDWQLGDARVWAPDGAKDLVLMAFVHLPSVLGRAATWLRPGGHLVVVGHARRNLTEGVGGPSDARLLHDPAELAATARAAGLEVLRCEEVVRGTSTASAIDAVLVARA